MNKTLFTFTKLAQEGLIIYFIFCFLSKHSYNNNMFCVHTNQNIKLHTIPSYCSIPPTLPEGFHTPQTPRL